MREIHVLRLPWDKTKKQTTVTDPSILQLQILDGLIKNKFVWLSVQKKETTNYVRYCIWSQRYQNVIQHHRSHS